MLETRSLTRRFGGLAAVNRVSLTVTPGEVRAIIGPNGAGKTTLFNLITGALAPSEGRILFKGRDVTGLAPAEIFRLGIVRSFQMAHVFPRLSVSENVALLVRGRRRRSGSPFARSLARRADVERRVMAALERFRIEPLADKPAGALAHGDRRLLEMAMVVAAEPDLLLLDEPTAGMSPEETRQTAALLRGLASSVTIVVVEHDMGVVMAISDRISVLHRGEVIAEGPPAVIRDNADVQAVYLGTKAAR
jgi:branched-chain amino acid transport system ATP-binding protein